MPNAIRIKTSSGWQDLALAGPPGAQGQPGPGERLISHTEFTAGVTVSSITEATPDIAVAAPAYVSDGVSPIWIEFWCPYVDAAVNRTTFLVLQQDGTSISRLGLTTNPTTTGSMFFPGVTLRRRLTPPAGSRVYRVGAFVNSAGANASIGAGSGGVGAYVPGYLRLTTEIASSQALIPLVSSLPANPTDGQEIYYLADATSGVIWHLRYRAASASPYKWEFLGGSHLYSYVGTSESRANASAGDLATVGPDVTVPLAGEYMVSWGSRISSAVAGAYDIYMGQNLNSEAVVFTSTAQYAGGSVSIHRRPYTLTAGALIRAKYSSAGGNNATWAGRWLEAIPVRVG